MQHSNTAGCILSKFYIKPQHNSNRRLSWQVVSYRNSTSNHNYRLRNEAQTALYLIEILHQTTTIVCVMKRRRRCILSKFYIKPQQRPPSVALSAGCILSKFYIKPQLQKGYVVQEFVVSYRNSTSNHNYRDTFNFVHSVVSYRNSTSNHNYFDNRQL